MKNKIAITGIHKVIKTAIVTLSFFTMMVAYAQLPSGTSSDPITNLADAHHYNSGRYNFNINGTYFLANIDNSEGGGWILVLQYIHKKNTNPALNIINGDFVEYKDAALGTDDSNNATSWGHINKDVLNSLTGIDEVRFQGSTSGHNRIIHFKTKKGLDYLKTGSGKFNGLKDNFTPLTGHTASLPEMLTHTRKNKGNAALTDHPFFKWGDLHWNIRKGNRWEVDDYCKNKCHTIHRVWVRNSTPSDINVFGDNDYEKAEEGEIIVDYMSEYGNVAPFANISSNITNFWGNQTQETAMAAMVDGNKSSQGKLNYAVHPMWAKNKVITFKWDKELKNGTFIFYNRTSACCKFRINNSKVTFKRNGAVVGTPRVLIASIDSHKISIDTDPDVIFDEVEIKFAKQFQNFREIEIFAEPLREAIPITIDTDATNFGAFTSRSTALIKLNDDKNGTVRLVNSKDKKITIVPRNSEFEHKNVIVEIRFPDDFVPPTSGFVADGVMEFEQENGSPTSYVSRIPFSEVNNGMITWPPKAIVDFYKDNAILSASLKFEVDDVQVTEIDASGIISRSSGQARVCSYDNPVTDLSELYNIGEAKPGTRCFLRSLSGKMINVQVNKDGWFLLMDYHHRGRTNPKLHVHDFGLGRYANRASLPSSSEGFVEDNFLEPLQGLGGLEPFKGLWGHASNAVVKELVDMGANTLRFYGRTSGHERIIDFTTSNARCLNYFATGANPYDCRDIDDDHKLLPSHTANLPEKIANHFWKKGQYAMTLFPFWKSGSFHWGVKGSGNRWEVDDYSRSNNLVGYQNTTLHRIWMRSSVRPSDYEGPEFEHKIDQLYVGDDFRNDLIPGFSTIIKTSGMLIHEDPLAVKLKLHQDKPEDIDDNSAFRYSRALVQVDKMFIDGEVDVEDLSYSWPDYVFEDNYTLKPLKEVEQFINKNKHLEGIPTEKEVKKNGINVAEMDVKLLKKIEELTLYIIELHNEATTQQQDIELLKKHIKEHSK